jgi:hypothetical protein
MSPSTIKYKTDFNIVVGQTRTETHSDRCQEQRTEPRTTVAKHSGLKLSKLFTHAVVNTGTTTQREFHCIFEAKTKEPVNIPF